MFDEAAITDPVDYEGWVKASKLFEDLTTTYRNP